MASTLTDAEHELDRRDGYDRSPGLLRARANPEASVVKAYFPPSIRHGTYRIVSLRLPHLPRRLHARAPRARVARQVVSRRTRSTASRGDPPEPEPHDVARESRRSS